MMLLVFQHLVGVEPLHPMELVGGAPMEIMGGAPVEIVGGAPVEIMGGAPVETVGGAGTTITKQNLKQVFIARAHTHISDMYTHTAYYTRL